MKTESKPKNTLKFYFTPLETFIFSENNVKIHFSLPSKRFYTMEEAQNISNKLLKGIDDLITELQRTRDENQQLRQQIVLLKAENEAKNTEISSLYDEISSKEKELENVLSKIQNVLGR